MMFSFTKKFTIAMFVFCSVQYVAYGSNSEHDAHDEQNPAQVTVHSIVAQKCQFVQENEEKLWLGPTLTAPIVEEAAYGLLLENDKKGLKNLALMCKASFTFIHNEINEMGTRLWKAFHGVTPEIEEIHQIFLNGKLVYRPDPDSDEGKVELLMAELSNPLAGTFDLSGCGATSKYLKITTDPSVFFKIEKINPKVNILIAPHFLINRLISNTATPFANILNNWSKEKAPVGIFWRWGADKDASSFDYLTSRPVAEISSKNLHDNYMLGRGDAAWRPYPQPTGLFHVCFVSQNKD